MLWSASLMVGYGGTVTTRVIDGVTFRQAGKVLGYSFAMSDGSLSVKGFELDDKSATVWFVLLMPSSSKLYLGVDHALSTDAELALHAGKDTFAVADATVFEPGPVPFVYVWDAPDANWAIGDELDISLRVAAPASAELKRLGIDGVGELEFDPDQHRYDTSADPGTETVTVDTDSAQNTDVEILVVRSQGELQFDNTDTDPNTPGHQTPLSANGDTLIIAATNDDVTQRVYIVTVTDPDNDPGNDPDNDGGGGVAPRTDKRSAVFAAARSTASTPVSSTVQSNSGSTPRSNTPTPDAALAALSVTGATLNEPVDSATHQYTADADADTARVTIAATPRNADAIVAITPDDADPDTPGHQIDLLEPQPGGQPTQTAVTIVIRSQSQGGYALWAYTITITRAAPEIGDAQDDPYEITMDLPEGCVLHDLDGDGSTPWMRWDDDCDAVDQPGQYSHRAAAQFFRLVVLTESTVSLEVDGDSSNHLYLRSADGTLIAHHGWVDSHRSDGWSPFVDASLTEILNPGVYVVEVAAQWHHWNRRGFELQYAGAYAHTGDDTKLSDLEISDVNLANFRAYTTDYARNVAADVDTVTVTPTRASRHSEVTIIPADANGIISGHQVSLEDGETEIMLTVASNVVSDLETVYRIRLTKLAGTTSPLSADAALSDLSFDNIDIGTFASGDTEYPYALDFYGALNGLVTTMTPTTANSGATWKSNRPDADPNADGHQISVNGDDTLAITVTSQDGANHRTYTMTPTSALRRDSSKDVVDVDYASGLWSDGERFLTTNPVDKAFAAYGVESGDLIEQFQMWAPSAFKGWVNQQISTGQYAAISTWWSHQALWSNGETLWVTYENNDVAYAYDLDTRQRDTSRDFALTHGSQTSFSALWSDGKTLYVHGGNYTRRWLYRYDLATGDYLGSQPLRFWSGSSYRVSGMWSDGKTLWIPTHGENVAAYDLHTLEYLPGLSFKACRGVFGLWSDGHTMWALGCRTIQAFTLPENARLKELNLGVGTIGLFNNGIFDYDAVVPAGTTAVTVTAEQAFTGGSSSVAFSTTDADGNAEGHQVSLTPGVDTEVAITVTAPNGTDTETYTITFTHDAGG